jgi:hypothetical protein
MFQLQWCPPLSLAALQVKKFNLQISMDQYPLLLLGTTIFTVVTLFFGLYKLFISLFDYLLVSIAIIVIYSSTIAVVKYTRNTPTITKGTQHFFEAKDEDGKFQSPLSSRKLWENWKQNRITENIIPPMPEFLPFEAAQKALNKLNELIVKDFVKSWFLSISHDEAWIHRADSLLYTLESQLYYRMKKVDFLNLLLSRVSKILIQHIHDFKRAEMLIQGGSKKYTSTAVHEEWNIAKHYKNGNLHPAVIGSKSKPTDQECNYIRDKLKRVVPLLLSKSDSASKLTNVIVREILVCCLIQPCISTFSDPDYLNQFLDGRLDQIYDEEENEHKEEPPKLPSYSKFLAEIQNCSNWIEFEEIREKLLHQIELTALKIESPSFNEKRDQLKEYLLQLNHCVKLVEKRIDEFHPPHADMDLIQILDNQTMRAALLEYLDKYEISDVFLFWRAVQEIVSQTGNSQSDISRNVDFDELIAKKLHGLYERYSEPVLGITKKTWSDMENSIDKLRLGKNSDPNCFREVLDAFLSAQQESFSHMLNEVYPKFILTSVYKQALHVSRTELSRFSEDIASPSIDYSVPRSSVDSSQDSSPKRSQSTKGIGKQILNSVFKKKSQNISLNPPSPKKKTLIENIDHEISLAFEDSDVIPHKSRSVAGSKKSYQEFSAESDHLILTKSNTASPSVEGDLLLSENEKSPADNFPSIIILPSQAIVLDETIEKLKVDIVYVEKQLLDAQAGNYSDEKNIKNLQYLIRGMRLEAEEVIKEKHQIELKELQDVILPGNCTVSIGETFDIWEDGKEFATYPIQVTRQNSEGKSSGWILNRRYSQFLTLHQALKAKYPVIISKIDMPGRLEGIMKLKRQLVEHRRSSLEKYLTVPYLI